MQKSALTNRIRRGLSEPHLVVRELNKYYYRSRKKKGKNDGVEMFEEDWDNLIILDACRYDTFAQRHTLPGTLEQKKSKVSSTIEWLDTYLDGADLRDTVYITANPQLYRKRDRVDVQFHAVEHIWQDDGWDDEFRTVRPETVAKRMKQAAETYPNKKIVGHFIQPHYPFIGETGQKHMDLDSLDFWNRVLNGEVTLDDEILWQAYEENFDLCMPIVEDLLETLQGKTVVTADHAEMIGERSSPIPMKEYGHPTELHTPELTTIPWHTYQNGERKEITVGDDSETTTRDETADVVQERLQDLGYA
ncbi:MULTISPECIES: hypothetical protein [unclassified Haladaptatus]|uniref:hypothetical protein n=1 Tax=unclassified Haladaptatus TaxID=2622732 RepID=UPI002FCE0B4C